MRRLRPDPHGKRVCQITKRFVVLPRSRHRDPVPHLHAMLPALSIFAIACYLLASGLLARPLFTGSSKTPATFARPALAIAALAVIAHASALLATHRGALDLHFFAALSLVACVVSALTLLVNLARPVATLGVIIFPISALLLGVDSFLAPSTAPVSMDWHIKLHVTVALLAFGVLSIAAAMAILLAIQERALRHRQLGPWLSALPPLTLTESVLFRLIGAGSPASCSWTTCSASTWCTRPCCRSSRGWCLAPCSMAAGVMVGADAAP
jgi:ABC-type uncharacterized transport system permease subunit